MSRELHMNAIGWRRVCHIGHSERCGQCIHCHELRIPDRQHSWRIVYHVAADAIVILKVFSKKTRETPPAVIEVCAKRLAAFTRTFGRK